MTQWQPFALPTNGMANPDTWREWAQVSVVMMISSTMVVIICTVIIKDIISIMHPAAGKGLAADHSGRRETHVCFPLQVFSLRPICLMTLVHVVLLCTHVLVNYGLLSKHVPQSLLSVDPSISYPKIPVLIVLRQKSLDTRPCLECLTSDMTNQNH